jgi:hypothetical protein
MSFTAKSRNRVIQKLIDDTMKVFVEYSSSFNSPKKNFTPTREPKEPETPTYIDVKVIFMMNLPKLKPYP